MKFQKSAKEKIIDVLIQIVLIVSAVVTIYPFIFVLSMSISDPNAVFKQEIWLYPKGFSIETYKLVFKNPNIWIAYYNTIWYTLVGTALNIVLTTLGAYPLSRKEFFARRFFMVFIAVTMFFSGGIIPSFILVNELGLYNSRWAIVLPAAVSAWMLIITRVYFQSNIPDSLPEAAKIDGANDISILLRLVIPLSKPIIAVIAIFTAVTFWNSYFTALIYLPDVRKHPLTILLQKLIINNDTATTIGHFDQGTAVMARYSAQLKYSIIMISILPIICIYPFFQKYFVQGVMIGAIKE